MNRRQALQEVLLDPPRFARGMLGHRVWDLPTQILRSVRDNEKTAVKACHASSKTFTSAEAALWWLTRYQDGVVITTAPTDRQVTKLLWGEIKKAVSTARIAYPEPLQKELRLGPDRYAFGFATDQGVNFQGFHGRMLIILDEAMGITGDIWEAIDGIRAGGTVHLLALGNPTDAAGEFYAAFSEQRADWKTYTISAFSTPNFYDEVANNGRQITLEDLLEMDEDRLAYAPWPQLVTRRWVKERFYAWGQNNPIWEARVLGQFPKQSKHAIIPLSHLEKAQNDEPIIREDCPLVAGIDVAGPGDDETTLFIGDPDTRSILYSEAWMDPDPRGEVVRALLPVKDRLTAVNVDSAGMGWYFYQHLKDLGFPAVPVNVGEKATVENPEQPFGNLKAQLYWQLREMFALGVKGLTDDLTIAQLSAIRWRTDSRGVTWIESKDEMRKRGEKSPDRAEGCMLMFAKPPKEQEDAAEVW